MIIKGDYLQVNRLIEELKKYNSDADVSLTNSEDIVISYISRDLDGSCLTPETTMQLFIEGYDKYRECSSEYMNGDIVWCEHYDKPCEDKESCSYFEEFDY